MKTIRFIINELYLQLVYVHYIVQMRFLRPLLGLTRLDHQRNLEIRNSFKVDNIVEDIK
jgi:hypothetical protein